MNEAIDRKTWAQTVVLLLVAGLLPASALGTQAVTTSAPSDFDALVRDLYRHPSGWQEALELRAPDMTINVNAFVPALTAALSTDKLRKLKTGDWDRLTVLVHLVGLKNVREARPLLRERMYDLNVPEPVRRQLAEAFARGASDPEVVEMLDSGVNVVVAAAIDWAGDREAPSVRSRIDRMLAEQKRYWGTHVGPAISNVSKLRDLIKQWDANPTSSARLDTVVSYWPFMFEGPHSSFRNGPSNTPLGRWLRLRLRELYAADPQTVVAELTERGKTNDLFLYILEELPKRRSLFFATTQPASTSQRAPQGQDAKG
jgi:hypothetical protein